MTGRYRPFFAQVPFAPEGGAGGGGAASAAGGTPPASLAAAAGIDPNKPSVADAADGSGTAAGAGDPAGAAAEGAAAAQQQSQAAQPYHPESLPADLRGASDKETIDRLLAKTNAPRAPEKEGDYKFELSDTTTKLVGKVDDDPVMAVYRGLAKKWDLSNDQANGFFNDFFGQLVDRKLIPGPVDYDAELKALQPQGEQDQKRAGADATRRVQAAFDFVNMLKARDVLTGDEANMLFGVANSAKGVVMLEKLAGLANKAGIKGGGTPLTPQSPPIAERFFNHPTS